MAPFRGLIEAEVIALQAVVGADEIAFLVEIAEGDHIGIALAAAADAEVVRLLRGVVEDVLEAPVAVALRLVLLDLLGRENRL
ncbi:hypothetical protein ACQ86N_18630 [Puia sp. P3]|uniref:hypothetical protein n=1 Tax=Puia sp. P3 TaxID=3423952 RepID=UPI003D6764F0